VKKVTALLSSPYTLEEEEEEEEEEEGDGIAFFAVL